MRGAGGRVLLSLARLSGSGFAAYCLFAVATLQAAEPPALWDPPAIDVFPSHDAVLTGKQTLKSFVADGHRLFVTRFNVLDGAGRPTATGDSKPTIRTRVDKLFQRVAGPDANSCSGCHNEPFVGGSGDFAANVFVGAHLTDPPTESITTSVTNERHTVGLFGSGAIDMLAREMTADLQDLRAEARIRASASGTNYKVHLMSKGIDFGDLIAHPDSTVDVAAVRGVDADLVVKPFGAKGVAVSIREFTLFALNQHHGIEAAERFGWLRTGSSDFGGSGLSGEFSVGQVDALTVFQSALPAPDRLRLTRVSDADAARLGEIKFTEVGCGTCHAPKLPLRSLWFLEPNPYNRPGAVVPSDVGGQIAVPLAFSEGSAVFRDATTGAPYVAAYTDLKRHVICDEDDPFFCNERVRQDFVPTNQFLTAKLWDIGTSMPYGHRGDLTTVSEAIMHHSGEAKEVKRAFLALPDKEKVAVITFLRSLQVTHELPDVTGWR